MIPGWSFDMPAGSSLSPPAKGKKEMSDKVIYDNTLDRAETAVEAYQYDLATALARIAEARAAERQAAALERIAAVLESVKGKAWVEEGYVDCLFVSLPRI